METKAKRAFVCSQRYETEYQHAFGVCLRNVVPDEETLAFFAKELAKEFGTTAEQIAIRIVKSNFFAYIRVGASTTVYALAGMKIRFATLLVKANLAEKATTVSSINRRIV